MELTARKMKFCWRMGLYSLIFMLLGGNLLIALFIDTIFPNQPFDLFYLISVIYVAGFTIPAVWLFIVCPILESRLRNYTGSVLPETRIIKCLFTVWFPALLALIIFLTCVTDRVLLWYRGELEEWNMVYWSLILFAICLPISYIVSRIVKKNFLASEHYRNHCHMCNYNLHGNTTGICPECGTDVIMKTEKSTWCLLVDGYNTKRRKKL